MHRDQTLTTAFDRTYADRKDVPYYRSPVFLLCCRQASAFSMLNKVFENKCFFSEWHKIFYTTNQDPCLRHNGASNSMALTYLEEDRRTNYDTLASQSLMLKYTLSRRTRKRISNTLIELDRYLRFTEGWVIRRNDLSGCSGFLHCWTGYLTRQWQAIGR